VRSISVVNDVRYEKGRISYSTYSAPPGVQEVLRLSFVPTAIRADGRHLARVSNLNEKGYILTPLENGDCIVTIRHDGRKRVVVEGPDPQEVADDSGFELSGHWAKNSGPHGETFRVASEEGAAITFKFWGNQVRLLGVVGPDGGWADAFVDGEQQPTLVECWNPTSRFAQPIFLKKGLANGPHQLRIVARGEKNPLARGTQICVEGAQFSAAAGQAGFGSGGGPSEPQRLIFGYTGRKDYIEGKGDALRPGTEFVARQGFGIDTVAKCWWRTRRSMYIGGTPDPEIYRYGVHAPEFWANLTVAPGTYLVRLHWADTPETPWVEREGKWEAVSRPTTVLINGETVIENLNVRNDAGTFKAYVREFPGVQPKNGIIELRFKSTPSHEAMIQAVEVIRQ